MRQPRIATRLFAAAVGLTMAGGLAAVTAAPAEAATQQTRVAVSQTYTKQMYGSFTTFSGRVQAKQSDGSWTYAYAGKTYLDRRLTGTKTWRVVGTDTDGGVYSFRTKAIQNAYYRVRYVGGSYQGNTYARAISGLKTLSVTRNLNDYLKKTTKALYIKGNVNPGWERHRITIQRKISSNGAWKAYSHATTSATGTYAYKMPVPRTGTWYYRAVVPRTEAYSVSLGNKYYSVYRTFGRNAARTAG